LLAVFGAERDAVGRGLGVLVGVPQGVDGVDQRPRQHDGRHGGADQQRPRCATRPVGQVKGVTRHQEAGDADPDQQRPFAAFGLVFAASEQRRA
jgi:hypothetical protein